MVRRIPRGARIAAAGALSTLIENAVDSGTVTSWKRLLCFPYAALSVPPQETCESEDTTLTSKVKLLIAAYMDGDKAGLNSAADSLSSESAMKNDPRGKPSAARNSDERLQRSVSLKLQDGDVRGAIRLLASDDQLARDSDDVFEALKAKHPPRPEDLDLPPAPNDCTRACLASEADVMATIAHMNSGSSAGLDGLRPAHLKDLVGRSTAEAGARLMSALTRLVNLALRGNIPVSAQAAFYSASLIALQKPCGGIRPIAIGTTYRRLATKVALRPLSAELGEELRPIQLGFGTPGGCEAAVHATRLFAGALS